MKTIKCISLALLLSLGLLSNAQVIVKVKPVSPRQTVIISTVNKPNNRVWIAGDWVVKGNNYVWKDGYYAKHKPGYHFREGHWKQHKHGWVWVPGKWIRIKR